MSFVLWEILIPLIIAFLLGLLFGWLLWGWRRTKITLTEWETMRQKANRSSSVEAEAEIAQLTADRDRLQAQVDSHVCETGNGADLGTGVLGLSGDADAAGAGDAGAANATDATAAGDADAANTGAAGADSDDDQAVIGERHPYGEGSHAPFTSDPQIQPDGYDIKGNADSMLYHRTDSRSYKATIAEVWFDTPERAEAAGFSLANSHPKS